VRTLSALIGPLLALALQCGSAAAAEPALALTIALPDWSRTQERLTASIYGQLWHDPAMAPLRDRMQRSYEQAMGKDAPAASASAAGGSADHHAGGNDLLSYLYANGIEPRQLVGQLRRLRLSCFALSAAAGNPPAAGPDLLPVRISSDMGSLAPAMSALLAKLVKEAPPPPRTAITIPGADEAFTDGTMALARFGSEFVIAPQGQQALLAPWQPAAMAEDLQGELDCTALATLAALIPPEEIAEQAQLIDLLSTLAPVSYRGTVVAEGLLETLRIQATSALVAPVDQAALARLPANAMTVLALGLDGENWWKREHRAWLERICAKLKTPLSPEDAERNADELLASVGLDMGLGPLISGLKGTGLVAVTAGIPFPCVSIAVPRSTGLDHLVLGLFTRFQLDAPADGASISLPIPGSPIPVMIARDAGHWLASSDPALIESWLSGKANGWSTSPAGTLALSKAADAWLIGASDTPAVLRLIAGFLPLGLNQSQDLDNREKQAVLASLGRLTALAACGYLVGHNDQASSVIECRSLSGAGLIPLVAAAIAIPNLLNQNSKSKETAVASTLRTMVFPAEMLFRGASRRDRRHAGSGDFGFFAELAQAPSPAGTGGTGGQPTLLPLSWRQTHPTIAGYRFALYLPDGSGGALSAEKDHDLPAGEPAQAGPGSDFVVYAWPLDEGSGRHAFAITSEGVVYAVPATAGEEPDWNDLFGGKGWHDPKVWKPFTGK